VKKDTYLDVEFNVRHHNLLRGSTMKIHLPITQPIRQNAKWEQRWNDADQGVIACWERGREKSLEDPKLASQARDGQLVVLPWKGGVEKEVKKKQKFGTFLLDHYTLIPTKNLC